MQAGPQVVPPWVPGLRRARHLVPFRVRPARVLVLLAVPVRAVLQPRAGIRVRGLARRRVRHLLRDRVLGQDPVAARPATSP